MKKIFSGLIGIYGLSILFLTRTVLAAENACQLDSSNPACSSDSSIFDTATGVIDVILAIVGVIATIMIIIGGVTISASAGDPGKVKKGKNMIFYAIIGLLIALSAFAIVNLTASSV